MADVEYGNYGSPYLHGFPSFCPICLEDSIKLRNLPGLGESHWHCVNPRCRTEWRVEDLIEAIEGEVI